MTDEIFDAILIGSGQAGTSLATALAESGQRTALVERKYLGGTCVNVGCTPSKTLVATARVAYLAKRARDFGIFTTEVRADMDSVIARKRLVVEKSNYGVRKRLEQQSNLEVLFGEGSFSKQKSEPGLHAIEVRSNDGGVRRLVAPRVFLNTGERPFIPKIDGLAATPFLDSTSIMELEELPRRLIVLGGGVIACEFAQMFRRFGSEVTILEREEHLLTHEDEDISSCMEEIFREDGIEVCLKVTAAKVSGGPGDISVLLRGNDGESTVRGSHLLVATGRSPNVEALALASAGVAQTEDGHIQVNDRLETNVPGVWALGDVNGGPAFTHIAYDDYRIIRANLIDGGNRTRADRLNTYCIFTDPEVGRVGMTEKEARQSGRKLLRAVLPMTYMARANEMAETRGLMKAIVDAATGEILGAAIACVDGGEVAAQIQIAMMGGLRYTALRDGIFSHPVRAEVLNILFGKLEKIE